MRERCAEDSWSLFMLNIPPHAPLKDTESSRLHIADPFLTNGQAEEYFLYEKISAAARAFRQGAFPGELRSCLQPSYNEMQWPPSRPSSLQSNGEGIAASHFELSMSNSYPDFSSRVEYSVSNLINEIVNSIVSAVLISAVLIDALLRLTPVDDGGAQVDISDGAISPPLFFFIIDM